MEFKNHTKEEVATIAAECFSQIKALTNWAVLGSWGISKVQYTEYEGMASLMLSVNGFLHKGYVLVSLDEGTDTYTVFCMDEKMCVVKKEEQVYFDQLGDVIDRLVERDERYYGKNV